MSGCIDRPALSDLSSGSQPVISMEAYWRLTWESAETILVSPPWVFDTCFAAVAVSVLPSEPVTVSDLGWNLKLEEIFEIIY